MGATRKIHAGKHSGSHGIAFELKTLGIEPTREELKKILHKVKVIGDTGRTVTDVDLDRIARDVIGLERENPFLKIKDLAVITGVNTVPTASVRLMIGDDETMTVAETGTWPR